MMSAKLATPGILQTKIYCNVSYFSVSDVMSHDVSVNDVNDKIFSRDSMYIVDLDI